MRYFFHLFLLFTLFSIVAGPIAADAAAQSAASRLANVAKTGGNAPYAEVGIGVLVGRLINAFLGLLGSIFLVLLIYGGYKWMMASGEEEEITKAKSIIRQAIIGLIIVMSAGAIAQFVVRGLESATTNS